MFNDMVAVEMFSCDLITLLLYSEVNAGIFYATAEEREKMVKAERAFTDEKVQKIIDLKKKVSMNICCHGRRSHICEHEGL